MESCFDKEKLLVALAPLQPHQLLAFGASCCERMMWNYLTFLTETGSGDMVPLRSALDGLWADAGGVPLGEARARELLGQCEAAAPSSEDFTSLYVTAAQDVCFALCSMLDFVLERKVVSAAVAALYSTDSVDLVVQEVEAMDTRDPERERKILEHPLMQQELRRQRRDVEEVSLLRAGDFSALGRLRVRASAESNLKLAT